MAYIIKNSDDSNYARADFISALGGLQPRLESGNNIKTINGNSVLGSGNIELSPREYTYDLTPAEEALKNSAISMLNEYNPIAQNTGKRKYITIGFITDTHTMPKNPSNAGANDYTLPNATEIAKVVGDMRSWADFKDNASTDSDAAIAQWIIDNWPTSDVSYYGESAESSIKILGSVAYDTKIDTVFCGGDLSSGRLPYDAYSYMMEVVAQKFEQYIPVPYFVVDGNHDRKYNDNVALRTNAVWERFRNRFSNPMGLSVHYVKNDVIYERKYVANQQNLDNSVLDSVIDDNSLYLAYYFDINRDGDKIRFVGQSSYGKDDGALNDWAFNTQAALTFKSDYKLPNGDIISLGNKPEADEWLVCFFSHTTNAYVDMCNAFLEGAFLNKYGTSTNHHYWPYINFYDGESVKGKGIASYIRGHAHQSLRAVSGDYNYPTVTVNKSFGNPCFSLFVFDTDENWVYELQVGAAGRNDANNPDVEGVYEKVENGVYRYKMAMSNHN